MQHTAIINRSPSPNQAPELPDFDFSTSDHSEEDQPNSMQAAPVSTSLPRAVSSILQWSTHFGVSDTGTSELFSILHKSFAIAGGSDDSITSIPTSLDKAIAMVNTMKQPKVSELLVCPDCLSVYGDWHEMQVSHSCSSPFPHTM